MTLWHTKQYKLDHMIRICFVLSKIAKVSSSVADPFLASLPAVMRPLCVPHSSAVSSVSTLDLWCSDLKAIVIIQVWFHGILFHHLFSDIFSPYCVRNLKGTSKELRLTFDNQVRWIYIFTTFESKTQLHVWSRDFQMKNLLLKVLMPQ